MRDDSTKLAERWRQDAALLRRYGAQAQAEILELCASDMEANMAAYVDTRVNLGEAVQLTGYSRSHLRRLIRTGKLRNVGSDDSPEFLAIELPRKVREVNATENIASGNGQPAYFSKQVARAIVRGEG